MVAERFPLTQHASHSRTGIYASLDADVLLLVWLLLSRQWGIRNDNNDKQWLPRRWDVREMLTSSIQRNVIDARFPPVTPDQLNHPIQNTTTTLRYLKLNGSYSAEYAP